MIDRLTPTAVTEWCDATTERAEATRGPGAYAIRLRDPADTPQAVRQTWESQFTAPLDAGFVERLAAAERFVYVGSHGKSVYARLCEHAAGEKSSTIMQAWPPVAVVDVWPRAEPVDVEWSYAVDVADETTAVWQDGTYF